MSSAAEVEPRAWWNPKRPNVGERIATLGVSASIGAAIVILYVVAAVAASLIAPYEPDELFSEVLAPPSGDHWFGTDVNGMDVFSRTVYATRIDLGLAGAAVAIALVGGIALGLLSGYIGGWLDLILVRVLDVLQAFPVLILAVAIVAATQQSYIAVVGVIALVDLPIYTRLVRTEVLRIRELPFVVAARAVGNRTRRLLRRHVLPNSVPSVISQTAVRFASAITVVAALAFVGVGIQAPTAEWGSMIRLGASDVIGGIWWTTAFPGLAIVILSLGLNLFADGLQTYLDPRSRATNR